jgi:hypothetical protein
METTINGDQSRQVNWNVRKTDAVSLTLTITQSSVAFDISTYVFIAEFYKVGNLTPIITLTQGSGITNAGATGILTIALTGTQTTLSAGQYFWKLRTTSPTNNTWLNGTFIVNDYTFDSSATNYSATIALNTSGNNVNVALVIAGSGTDATSRELRPSTYPRQRVIISTLPEADGLVRVLEHYRLGVNGF